MSTLLFFAMATIGMAHIICDSTLFATPRTWFSDRANSANNKGFFQFVNEIINCYQCCGFWCGMFMGAFFFMNPSPFVWFIQTFAAGCAGSFLSMWAGYYIAYLDAKSIVAEIGDE